jgi:GNAT superfamily N-acetyltransferase
MATMMAGQEIQPGEVLIQPGRPEDNAAAEALWASTGARPCANGEPLLRIVARYGQSNKFLGVADCFRTFPPEEGLAAVAVVPEERRRGVGAALLRELAHLALRSGRRTLGGFMRDDDAAAWHLLRAAGIPVRLHEVQGGLYYELDLIPMRRAGRC